MLDLASLRKVTQASCRPDAAPGPALYVYLVRAVCPSYPAHAACLTNALLHVDECMGSWRHQQPLLYINVDHNDCPIHGRH